MLARENQVQPPLALRINGALLALGRRPELSELDPALRGIALSDSPVLLRAHQEEDRERLGRRLHELGRRKEMELHLCRSYPEARALIEAFESGPRPSDQSLGTWLLYEVSSWSPEEQRSLGRVLSGIDEGRLQSRLGHERIPRVVVLEGLESRATLSPELERRLSFFHIQATAGREKELVR